jgi:hypothetical protein
MATDGDEASWMSSSKSQVLIALLATSITNQYGFWHIFHIAILEHIGITDVPRLAVWPLISLSISMIAAIAGMIISPRRRIAASDGTPTALGKFLLKYRFWIGLAFLFAGEVVAFLSDAKLAANVAPLLFAAGFFICVDHDIQIPAIRMVITPSVLALTVAVLGISYGNGVVAAVDIRDGEKFLRANFPHQPNDSLRYLARVGEHVFFYDPTKRAATLYELKNVEPLSLTAISSSTAKK